MATTFPTTSTGSNKSFVIPGLPSQKASTPPPVPQKQTVQQTVENHYNTVNQVKRPTERMVNTSTETVIPDFPISSSHKSPPVIGAPTMYAEPLVEHTVHTNTLDTSKYSPSVPQPPISNPVVTDGASLSSEKSGSSQEGVAHSLNGGLNFIVSGQNATINVTQNHGQVCEGVADSVIVAEQITSTPVFSIQSILNITELDTLLETMTNLENALRIAEAHKIILLAKKDISMGLLA